ncbi:MAG: ribonuclease III [Chloroflexi bacterium]|nr:ribonuclease III [Chloroflexota bacterium]
MEGPVSEEAIQDKLGVVFRDPLLLREALVHPSYSNENPNCPFDNERLEFLGDALLDYMAAERFFREYPGASEGDLTSLRVAVVNGETLSQVALRLGLGEYLYLGQGEEATGGRVRPSNLASALEALIGALYLDRGIEFVREWVTQVFGEELAQLRARGVPKDAKSQLQERVQALSLGPPEYRLVEERGPAHAPRFLIEVLVGRRVLGRGEGRRKAEAEKAAAQVALQQLEKEIHVAQDPLV